MLDTKTRSIFNAVMAGGLSALMVGQLVLAEAPAKAAVAGGAPAQLQGHARVLHALNRFTFGPRPGDVAAVEAVGLDKWFEQQLNPESITDIDLDRRLAQFPAMQLSQEELMRKFPGPQMLRQAEQRGGMAVPRDPMEQALYRDEMEIYKKVHSKVKAGQTPQDAAASMRAEAGVAQSDSIADGGDGMQAGSASDSSMKAADASAAAKKKGGVGRVNMLGTDSSNSGNLKKPGQDAAVGSMMAADDGGPAGARGAAVLRHKEQFYPEAKTQEILVLAPRARVQRILEMEPEEMVNFRKSLSVAEFAALVDGLNPQQREFLEALQGTPRMIGGEILQSRLDRDVYSERQLEAVMTDFWLNHFNVYIRKNQNEPYLIPSYERDVIRPHALGKFEDLLVATAKSPAMLVYLDNWQSVGPDSQAAQRGRIARKFAPNSPAAKLMSQGLNENYGRELMELHTVGAACAVDKDHPAGSLPKQCGGGYTQKDVTEVAKVFTGWGIDRPAMGAEYAFQPQRHEPGQKDVLGQTIGQSGEREGMEVLHLLATSPATAHFICNKLAVRFVSDAPPQALVERMAQTFLTSGGDIKTVLQTMYKSPEFWAASTESAKIKTPLEFVVSAVRASGAQVNNGQALVQTLDRLGMPLYGMQTPNGYSWMAAPWTGTGDLVNRMNFALVLSGNRLNGVRVDWGAAAWMRQVSDGADGMNAEAEAKERKLEMALLGRPVSEKTRGVVLAQFANPELEQQAERDFPARMGSMNGDGALLAAGAVFMPQDRQAAVMAGLLLGSPEFQRR